MWYDLGSSEEGEIAISCQLAEPLAPTPTLWMWIRSVSLPVKEQNTLGTANASSATKRDATCTSTGDISGKEEEEDTRLSWRKTTETTREVQADLQVANFMRQHNISTEHTIELMGNYYSHNNAAVTWEETTKQEFVKLINLDF